MDLLGGEAAMAAFSGSYSRIEGLGFTVHWMEPDRIVLKTGDQRITKPDGSRPGIWISASCNPDSADYDPNLFNRLAGILRNHGQPAPDPVPEHGRRLDRRWPLLSPQMQEKITRQVSSH
jgi:hypothetical protein